MKLRRSECRERQERGVAPVSSGRMRTPRCPLLCWTGRQQFRHFLGRIDAAGHGAVHDGRPPVVACQEGSWCAGGADGASPPSPEPAGLAHAHGFAPAVNAGEPPRRHRATRSREGDSGGRREGARLDLLVVKSGSSSADHDHCLRFHTLLLLKYRSPNRSTPRAPAPPGRGGGWASRTRVEAATVRPETSRPGAGGRAPGSRRAGSPMRMSTKLLGNGAPKAPCQDAHRECSGGGLRAPVAAGDKTVVLESRGRHELSLSTKPVAIQDDNSSLPAPTVLCRAVVPTRTLNPCQHSCKPNKYQYVIAACILWRAPSCPMKNDIFVNRNRLTRGPAPQRTGIRDLLPLWLRRSLMSSASSMPFPGHVLPDTLGL